MKNIKTVTAVLLTALLILSFAGCARINQIPQMQPAVSGTGNETNKPESVGQGDFQTPPATGDESQTSPSTGYESQTPPSTGYESQTPPAAKLDAPFVDIDWHHLEDPERGECDTLTLTSDGYFYFNCECGEPIENSDLYETYKYDEASSAIVLESAYAPTRRIKILGAGDSYLLVKMDDDIKCFVKAGSCLGEKYPIFFAERRLADEYGDDSTGLFKIVSQNGSKLIISPDGSADTFEFSLERDAEIRLLTFSSAGGKYDYKVSRTEISQNVGKTALVWIDEDHSQIDEILFIVEQ